MGAVAGVGAGTGLLVGSMAGSEAAQSSGRGAQARYDHAYVQCMYAKGEQVPLAYQRERARQTTVLPVMPAAAALPPPPNASLPLP